MTANHPLLIATIAGGAVIQAGAGAGTTFTSEQISRPNPYTRFPSLADLDQDGDLDIINATVNDEGLYWQENLGEAGFDVHTLMATDRWKSTVVLDFDGDGDLDIIAIKSRDIAALENDGNFNFTVTHTEDVSSITDQLVLGDVDGDGVLDIMTNAFLDWFSFDSSTGFVRHQLPINPYDEGNLMSWYSNAIHAADFNDNGNLDLVVCHDNTFDPDVIAIIESDGVLNESSNIHPVCTMANSPQGFSTADIDNDGDLDVLVAERYEPFRITWHENLGDWQFTEHVIAQGFGSGAWGAYRVRTADFDQDGDVDVFSSAYLDDAYCWHENDGQGNFQTHFVETDADRAVSLRIGDIDGDGDIDAVGASPTNGGTIHIMRNQLISASCPADLDADGVVGSADLAALLGSWGETSDAFADFNSDGQINAADLATLLGSWGPCQ